MWIDMRSQVLIVVVKCAFSREDNFIGERVLFLENVNASHFADGASERCLREEGKQLQ